MKDKETIIFHKHLNRSSSTIQRDIDKSICKWIKLLNQGIIKSIIIDGEKGVITLEWKK